jgi:ApbE superfamily uncharacterized protein (UPF0280 family)
MLILSATKRSATSMKDQSNYEARRTLMDLIAEHPKLSLSLFLLIVAVLFYYVDKGF